MVDTSRAAATLLGFLAAALVFAALFWFIGVDRILRALGRADLALVAVVGLMMALWVVAMGLALWVVLGTIGARLPARTAVLVFASAAFANNVTPFGQAGGEPIAALLISDVSDSDYETALAGIASADAINFVPSVSLALLGVGVYATQATLTDRLEFAVGSVLLLGGGIVAATVVVWHRRTAVERAIVRALTPPLRLLARVVPRVTVPDPDRIEEGFERFFAAIERVATDRERLAMAVGCATAGLVLQALAMWLTFVALGATIPIQVPFFVIPLGTMAAVGPTPGGLGGIESVHIVLLASTTSVGAGVIAAAVVIHRVGGFWLTNLIGGGSIAVLGAHSQLT